MIMGSQQQNFLERRDSRKRRRLSERRRVFGRMGLSGDRGSKLVSGAGNSATVDYQDYHHHHHQDTNQSSSTSTTTGGRDSPLSFMADQTKISMKIQFHITVAPENEPLILDTSHLVGCAVPHQPITPPTPSLSSNEAANQRKKSTESIGEHLHERLSRQNTASTRRRQQLLAMHNQAAGAGAGEGDTGDNSTPIVVNEQTFSSMPERLATSSVSMLVDGETTTTTTTSLSQVGGRESGARSSTITDGMSDEATKRFLAKHQATNHRHHLSNQSRSLTANPTNSLKKSSSNFNQERELVYFKRDGQRFKDEFTLKLSVDKTYRCLLKIRPLIPLQAISIQGHHVLFADCSQQNSSTFNDHHQHSTIQQQNHHHHQQPASAPASSLALNRSWQSINQHSNNNNNNNKHNQNNDNQNHNHNHNNHHRLCHNQTIATTSSSATSGPAHNATIGRSLYNHQISDSFLLYQQQQSQMMRHFSATHCSSTNSHLGTQLIYMFDWAANRFEVNKNKNRTQVQTVLKFKNGQILSLPMQIKFYEPECKQHLSWGSQLHFIDYDCSINNMGQINVDRVQYY